MRADCSAIALSAQSLGRVALQQSLEKVYGIRRQTGVLLQFVRLDLVKHFLSVLVELRRDSVQHFIEQHSQQLPVHTLPVATLVQHFRCQIRHTAAEGRGVRVVVDLLLTEAEVCQLGVSLLVQNHIVRF